MKYNDNNHCMFVSTVSLYMYILSYLTPKLIMSSNAVAAMNM